MVPAAPAWAVFERMVWRPVSAANVARSIAPSAIPAAVIALAATAPTEASIRPPTNAAGKRAWMSFVSAMMSPAVCAVPAPVGPTLTALASARPAASTTKVRAAVAGIRAERFSMLKWPTT